MSMTPILADSAGWHWKREGNGIGVGTVEPNRPSLPLSARQSYRAESFQPNEYTLAGDGKGGIVLYLM